MPHGLGTLRYESGDEYRGDFVDGKQHGQGMHVRATGEIYEGGFQLGQRHGQGTLTLPGVTPRSSTWVDGHEMVASPQPLLVQWGGSTNPFENSTSSAAISLAVTSDQRKNAEVRRALQDYEPITYTHQISSSEVTILPDDQKLLSYWKRDGVIYDRVSRPDNAYADEEGFKYKTPAFLRIALQNAGAGNAELRQLYLDIAASTTETMPLLSVWHGVGEEGHECGAEARKLEPTFTIHNEGWSNVGPSTLSFSFSLRPGKNLSPQKFSQQLKGFKDTSKVSILTELQSMGLDVAQLQSWHFKCPSYDKLKSCQAEAIQRARLGQLRPYAYFGGSFGTQLGTSVAGVMTYTWQNSKGGQENGSAKFKAHIHLASIEVEVPAECGAGVPEDPKAGVPVLALSLDKGNYKLSYPLRGKVSVGQRPREFTLGLTATKSSHHAFRVVAEFADGKKKVSQPIKLTYFKPRITPPPQ